MQPLGAASSLSAASRLRFTGRLQAGHQSALLVMPTGAGKTVVFTEIARSATARGNSVFVLVHRRELVNQASDKLKKQVSGTASSLQASNPLTTEFKSPQCKPWLAVYEQCRPNLT